ncbi:MAG: flippase-like domain-containing protein [Clostridia bacterium]|nr:flippase-like domain-containing protein [Clostridia bacterium]
MEENQEEKLNSIAASEETEVETQSDEQEVQADLNGDGVVDEDEAEIDEALKSLEGAPVEAPKKKKHAWIGYVLLAGVICLSVWAMLEIVRTNDPNDFKSFGEVIAASDWRFALISLAVLLVTMACICFEYVVIIKATTGKTRIRTGIKVGLLGKFYDNVTPFGTGGQPMQIYYLHKKGLSGGASSAVILTKYFVWMICWLTVSLLLMACNTQVLSGLDDATRILLLVAGWVGLGINMLLPLMILLFAVLPKFSNKLASLVVGLGYKVKIVKDKEKTLAKATKVVSDFRTTFKIISKRPLLFVILIILCIIEVFLNFSLPYFLMRTFSVGLATDFSTLIAVTAINTYVAFGVALIPTPGNTGAMEGMGALAFSMFVTGAMQFWSMFSWRFATYYIYILIGLCLTVYEIIRKIHRARKAKKSAANLTETLPTDNSDINNTKETETNDEET